MDNGNNTIRLLVSLGCALGTNWYYSYISLVISLVVACVQPPLLVLHNRHAQATAMSVVVLFGIAIRTHFSLILINLQHKATNFKYNYFVFVLRNLSFLEDSYKGTPILYF